MGWRGAIAGTVAIAVVVGGLGLGGVMAFSATGVNLSGTAGITGQGSGEVPLMARGGFVRNTAPFALEIVSVSLDGEIVTDGVKIAVVSRDRYADEAPAATSAVWHGSLKAKPITLRPDGTSKAVWIALSPPEGGAIGFSTFEITFRGPLGFSYSVGNKKISALAFSPELADGVASLSPAIDRAAVGGYLDVLGPLIRGKDAEGLAIAMGAGATEEDAVAFIETHTGIAKVPTFQSVPVDDPARTFDVTIQPADEEKPVPAFRIAWADSRWTVVTP